MTSSIATENNRDDRPRPVDVHYRIARRSAAVAGVFSLIVTALLLYDFRLRGAEDPFEEASFKALTLALAQQPDNDELRENVRLLDVQLRRDYFRRRVFAAMGGWLLLGGVAVFLIALKSAATLRRKLPTPEGADAPQDLETRWTRIGRRAVAVLTVVLIGVAVGLGIGLRSDLPKSERELAAMFGTAATDPPPKASPPPSPPPSDDEIRKMWPRFRGPDGSGISAYTNIPTSWDGSSGEGVLWKVPVPLPGLNSPVVWADRVFLSGANQDRREVYCFDAGTGKILWQEEVPADPRAPSAMEEPEFSGFAAPTTATDGRYVFAIFATGDLAAFDVAGKLLWNKHLGVPDNPYGHASSLATYGDVVLVQIDQGMPKQEKSRLYAFDAATGKTVWEARRKVSASWTTPIIIRHEDRVQVITCADPWLIAYDPAGGKELYRAKVISGECGPSPVLAAGAIHVGNEYCQWSAVGAGGEGDVTETHVLWTAEDGLPDTCSPLVTDEFVFLMPGAAYFTCLDAKTGELLWEHEFNATFTSSPSLVGDRIYLFGEVDKEGEEDEEGLPVKTCKASILEFSREKCEVVGESDLGEGCVTSPAFQDGRMYIRGKKHLFCIGQP